MKHYIIFLLACSFWANTSIAQIPDSVFTYDKQISDVKPWTNSNFNNNTGDFQFVIVSDRTNGHRPGVFKDAIEKVNQLNPEFVISVGDYIEGYTTDTTVLNQQWNEFHELIKPLKMPFFLVPGNHDVSNEIQRRIWKEQYGKDYYHYIYKNVLFVIMNSNDGDGIPFSEKQLADIQHTLKSNDKVKWTFLLMHHPVWNKREINGFSKIEETLKNRPYTVIAGHTHRYLHESLHKNNYYTLGTTGGSSKLRGSGFGETDHITWVTMKDTGPSLINLELKGIQKHDFSNKTSMSLSKTLTQDASFKPLVLLPSEGKLTDGKVMLKYTNHADLSLKFSSKFYQHPRLDISESQINFVLPPNSEKQVILAVSLKGNNHHSFRDSLELQWNLNYVTQEKGLPTLDGVFKIPVQPSIPDFIVKDVPVFTNTRMIKFRNNLEHYIIRFTVDGKDPDSTSTIYQQPFSIKNSTTIKTRAYTKDGKASSLIEAAQFTKLDFSAATKINRNKLKQGLSYQYYEGEFKKIPNFSSLKPLKSGIINNFDLEAINPRQNQFAILFEGYIAIQKDDLYTFYLTSDDGCKLFIDGKLVVDNDGSHSAREKSGFAALNKGFHTVRIEYFEDFDGELIKLEYAGDGGIRNNFPFKNLFTKRFKD